VFLIKAFRELATLPSTAIFSSESSSGLQAVAGNLFPRLTARACTRARRAGTPGITGHDSQGVEMGIGRFVFSAVLALAA
jgi:hypothetical protein